MSAGRDDESPAHYYTEQWRADRQLKMRCVIAWVAQTQEPIRSKLFHFLHEEYSQWVMPGLVQTNIHQAQDDIQENE